jgi:hypothetical protein
MRMRPAHVSSLRSQMGSARLRSIRKRASIHLTREFMTKLSINLQGDFAIKVPDEVFSPAEILSFLLEYKHSPTDAVTQVEEWVNRTKDKWSA